MKNLILSLSTLAIVVALTSCDAQSNKGGGVRKVNLTPPAGKAVAAFASGCFWCAEHVFDAVMGVDSVINGYAGGKTPNPTYELVCTETTGHAESVLIYYDPKIVTYEDLLKVFFTSHDPTTLDRQGPDRGSSYRSIIFFRTAEEETLAEQAKKDFAPKFRKPIVSEIKAINTFYRAEEYHQNFADQNPDNSYIENVSIPRFEQFKKTYKGKVKENENH